MQKSGIYKITNPENAIYIGHTINIEQRWDSYENGDCKGQKDLFKSFFKYGILNHKFEFIHQIDSESDISLFREWESYYWDKYKNEGFTLLNKSCPYNKKVIKEKKKTPLDYRLGKPITQFDRYGKLIKVWNSTIEASDKLGISRACIYMAIKKDYAVLKKYRFREGIINKDIEVPIRTYKRDRSRIRYKVYRNKIIQYDKSNNFIKTWENAKEAEKVLGIKSYYINRVANPNEISKESGGFIWKRAPIEIKVIKKKPFPCNW